MRVVAMGVGMPMAVAVIMILWPMAVPVMAQNKKVQKIYSYTHQRQKKHHCILTLPFSIQPRNQLAHHSMQRFCINKPYFVAV